MPSLLVADESGQIYDHPYLKLAARSGHWMIKPDRNQLIPLPFGSQLFTMPGRIPVGWDKKRQEFVPCERFSFGGIKKKCYPVAAFLAPGFLRTLLPATRIAQKPRIDLPLWA